MPLENYGVWIGHPISFEAEKTGSSPHLHLWSDEDPNAEKGSFKAAINIKSSTREESRLVYWFVRNLEHLITQEVSTLSPGWNPITTKGLPALDYIRANIVDHKDGTLLKHNELGENDDIIDFISPVLDLAIQRKATIYLYGESFPGGIHDVHMNQGNSGHFEQFNGVWQDGGVLLHFPDGHWEGIFLAFAVQKTHTEEDTGNPIGDVDFATLLGGPTIPKEQIPSDVPVQIRAAILNPIGPDVTTADPKESVYLTNRTTQDIKVDGWTLVNRNGNTQALSGVLKAQSSTAFAVPNCPLSNNGGTITLLDAEGLKVDGVSYTKQQAAREGDLVYFH